ncbi:MAG: hypothetical protein CBC38_05190 [Gammaproteobacteria bacterium TMED78]|nr:MAG: hypothetical protein CBC38_05190 [Gammaproteobacteria bacterium TMED78]
MLLIKNISIFLSLSLLFSTYLHSDEYKITAGGPQSSNLPWIGVIKSHFIPRVNQVLEENNSEDFITWREAFGGSLYKWQNSLEAIEIGLTDIGWVGALWETSKMPLQNVTYYTPFVTDDLPLLLDIFNHLHKTVPSLNDSWSSQNQILLGASGVDTYHLMTTFPVNNLEDISGKKILAPGPSASWLEGTNAVAVNGGLSTYYTQISTGVADGVLTILSGAYPYRIHEVAPYITLVGIGAQFNGGLAINKKKWNSLTPEMKEIFYDLGLEYSQVMGEVVNDRYEIALESLVKEGAIITELSPKEKEKWVFALPNIAGRWADSAEKRGFPAREILEIYMEAVRENGETPLINWDKIN